MYVHWLRAAFILGYSCSLAGLAGAQAPSSANDSEKALKAASFGTDDSSLLDYFRKRTLQSVGPVEIQVLVRQLGDANFKIRQKASGGLIALGAAAKPYLSEAMKSSDAEVARRAEDCLDQILKPTLHLETTIAAIRLLTARKAAGAGEVLVGFAPFAENDIVTEEIEFSLAELAAHDGHVKKTLLAALHDQVPCRRALAAVTLCRSRDREALAAVTALLEDSDLTVRLKTAVALVHAKDKRAIAVLIELLARLPQPQAWQAEDVLVQVAGDKAPAVSLGSGADGHRKCRDAWLAWYRMNEATIDWSRLEEEQRLLGYTLAVLIDEGKIQELGPDNKVRYEIDGLDRPLDVQLLSDGHLLVTENESGLVSERNTNGEILWRKKVAMPLMAQRLPNGRTFIAAMRDLAEVDREGDVVWGRPLVKGGEFYMKAQKLPNGDIAVVAAMLDGSRQFVRMDASGREIQKFPVNLRTSGGRIDVLHGGRVLVPEKDLDRVAEYDADGKIIWEAKYPQPVAAVRLPNGNTLVTSFNSDIPPRPFPRERLVPAAELDRTGKVVWTYSAGSRVTRVLRR
jgi:hypothetical protein